MTKEPIGRRRPRRSGWRILLLLIPVPLVGLGVHEGIHWWRHVHEPNATVEADFTVLASSVDGRVASVHVRRGDTAEKGSLLVGMDPTSADFDVRSLEAELEKEKAVRREAEAELALFKAELTDRLATVNETVRLLRRELAVLDRRRDIAEAHVERSRRLHGQSVVPQRHIDEANDRLLEVTGKLRDIQTRITVNEKRADELSGTSDRERIFLTRFAVIDRNLERIGVRLRQARQRVRDMHVRAPARVVVSEVHVSPGTYVERGDRVLLVHDAAGVWIEANIGESEIRHVRPGQKVAIEIDGYPDETFGGEVRSIGPAAVGAAEPDKGGRVAERRIPVVIDLPETGSKVWPGMRASVNIRIR